MHMKPTEILDIRFEKITIRCTLVPPRLKAQVDAG